MNIPFFYQMKILSYNFFQIVLAQIFNYLYHIRMFF